MRPWLSERHELRGKVQPPKFRALRLEPLEDRHLLTVLIWDPHQSGGAKLGGAGTWTNGGAAVWYNPDTRANVVWNNANGDTAVFEGTAGTVAVDSGVSAGGIGFETSGYAIGGDAITLTANIDSGWANGEIRTNGATEVINAVLGGSVGLTKTGTGTLTLSAMSTYGGATAIQNGTLAIARGDDRLPTGTTVTLGDEQGDSGVLQLGDGTTSCSQSLADLYIDGDGSHNRVVGGGTATATLTLTAEDVDEYDGILGGPGTNQNNLALEMDGSGVLLLTEDNTYAGDTYLNDGATGAGDTYVNDDVTPTLDTDSAFGTGSIYLNGATFGGSGTVGNNIVVEDDSTIIAIDTLTLGGDISDPSGPVNLTLCNFHGTDCVLQLGGDNSGFTGTLTQSVDHNIAGYGSLTTELLKPSAGSSQANWDISDVLVSNIDPRVSTAPMIELGSLSGGGTLTNVVAKSTVTYQIGGNNQSSEFDGVAEDGDGDAAVALVKTGEAMLTLGGVNTYGGGTTVEAGILEAKNTGRLPHYTTSGSVVVSIGATLGVNVGVTGEWSASDISTLLSSVALTSGRALGIDTTDGNFTLANAISGSLGITKLGANTLTLTGMNSFTGGTKLIDGVLSVSGDDALAPGPITLSGGTLLDLTVEGTLTLDGSISGSGTIDCTGLNQNSVLKLAGDNSSFGGELDVSSGTVYFDSVSAGSALATWGLDGGVLANDVSGTPTIALGTLSGSGGTLNNAMTGSTVTYQIGGNNQSTEFDGVIEDGADTVALTEVGTGTQTLGGENTYTGGTTITQGTLRGSGSSFGTGSITLANLPGWGATLSSNGTLANAIVAAAGTESTVNAYLSPLTLTGGFSGTGWIIHTGAQLNLAGDNGSFQGTFWQTGDDSLVTCFTSVSAVQRHRELADRLRRPGKRH